MEDKLNKDAIIELVRDAGVTGAGGAGFPTHVKLAASADAIVVNGAECEPLLHVDIHLLADKTDQVMSGLSAAMKATGAGRAYIAVKRKYEAELGRRLRSALRKAGLSDAAEPVFLPNVYPMGDEQVLVYQVLGRIVPPGGIPLSVGAVVINVETLYNISRALEGRPVVRKFLTVGGEVPRPLTMDVPVGTPVADVLSAAGTGFSEGMTVVDGGPMMGKVIGPEAVVTKTTKGVLVFPSSHAVLRSKVVPLRSQTRLAQDVCCLCRTCTDVCPRYLLGHGLEPHRYMRSISRIEELSHGGEQLGDEEIGALRGALLCSECGVCEVIGCRMGLSPRSVNQAVKKALAKAGVRYQGSPDGQPGAGTENGEPTVRPAREEAMVSSERLLLRADLERYDRPSDFVRLNLNPKYIRLPLTQHIGAPSIPTVEDGQIVAAGALVAAIPEGKLGANIHTCIRGVAAVGKDAVTITGAQGAKC